MLRWMDGYEQYGSKTHMLEGLGGGAAYSQVSSFWSLSTANPATGTYHLRLGATPGGGEEILRRVLGQSSQVSGLGYRFSVADLPSAEAGGSSDSHLVMSDFRDHANSGQCRVAMGTDGAVYAVRGATYLGRSDPCIAPGGYHHFEAKTKIDNTTGYVEVRVNEVTVLNLTGVDTQTTTESSTAQFVIGEYGDVTDPGAQFGSMDVDDMFAWDDDASDATNTVVDFVGDKGCYLLLPNADTAEADWLKSTGVTGYSLIDEVPPSGADYLSDSTGAARSIFDVSALPANVAEVIAMQGFAYVRKEEAGTVTMRLGLVSGVDESYGPDDSPSTEYAYLRPAVKTIDPDTGVPWATNAEPKLLIERTV